MEKSCTNCSHPYTNEPTTFCVECGAELLNYCSNKDACPNNYGDDPFPLGKNDKYCGECGSKSTHLVNGYFND